MSIEAKLKKKKGNYGKPHFSKYYEDFIVLPSGEKVLKARHRKHDLEGLYRQDGSVVTEYGGMHDQIRSFVDVPKRGKALKAQPSAFGPEGLFLKSGRVIGTYGGMHYFIGDFKKMPDGEDVLYAMDKPSQPGSFFRKNGSTITDYGGTHRSQGEFIKLPDGEYILYCKEELQGIWDRTYLKDGTCYGSLSEVYFTHVIAPLIGKFDLAERYRDLNSMISCNIRYHHEIKAVYEALASSLNAVIERNSDNPFDVQKVEVERILKPVYDVLKYHPEKFMEGLKVVQG